MVFHHRNRISGVAGKDHPLILNCSGKGSPMKRFTLVISALAIVMVAFPTLGRATQFYSDYTIGSEARIGSFTGDAAYSYLGNDQASLTVQLRNTTSESNEGYITALAFLLPSEQITVQSMFSTTDAFKLLLDDGKNLATPPFDKAPFDLDFDFGASIGQKWLSGGKPQRGIEVGSTETFTFNLTGSGLALLSLSDFTATNNVFTAVRFMGFEDGGSDKVLGVAAGAQVPEPATFLLFASGMLGYALLKRRSHSPLRS